MIDTSRRNFLIGATSLVVAAPSIVRASSLMDIKGVLLDPKVLAYRYMDMDQVAAEPIWFKSVWADYPETAKRMVGHIWAWRGDTRGTLLQYDLQRLSNINPMRTLHDGPGYA